jgi:hypothetical protein
VAGQWFSPGNPVSSTNKTDCHDITEILLKVALNTITLTLTLYHTKVRMRTIVINIYFVINLYLIIISDL